MAKVDILIFGTFLGGMVMRIIVLLLLSLLVLKAEQWVVIGHGSLPKSRLDADHVRALYLGKKHYLDDQRIKPLNLKPEDPLRQAFEAKILHLDREEIHAYWIKQHYLGMRPPKVLSSIEVLLRYVEKVEGTIGYVPLSAIGKHHVYVWYIP